jgi:hypothetical protein
MGDYNGWTNWDTWNVALLMDNSEPSYKWMMAWHENFMRKIKSGKFSMEKAKLVVRKYIIPTARGTKKPIFYDPRHDFVGDPDIDPSKVNQEEIVNHIIHYGE